jgi:general secretion pathway protein G
MSCLAEHRRRRHRRAGFTLMEVLLVLVILVILGSLVGVGISQNRRRAFNDAANAQIKLFRNALQIYEMDLNGYPNSSQGLQALVEMPSGLANESRWRGPYLDNKVLPLDPWDNAYQYELNADGASYTIKSAGVDGVFGTEDDVTNE